MIAIVNVGPQQPASPLGVHAYEVRINQKVVAVFRHKREDGLSACLISAAKAVEKEKWEEGLNMLNAGKVYMSAKKCPYQAGETHPETCSELVRRGYPKQQGLREGEVEIANETEDSIYLISRKQPTEFPFGNTKTS